MIFSLQNSLKRLEYEFALLGGPWIISGHYLIMRQWSSNFVQKDATIDKAVMWTRFPGLCMEYFNVDFMEHKL